MSKPDFNYTNHGFFVRLYPNNDKAVEAYNIIAKWANDGAIMVNAWPSVRNQLREAGYTIHIQKPKPATRMDIDKLLAELGS